MPERWSLPRRVAFRFSCAYVLLYFFPPPFLYGLPRLPALLTRVEPTRYAPWLARHLLHLTVPPPPEHTGSGDTAAAWAWIACALVIAAAVTLVWSVADRQAPAYPRLADALRTFIRYSLACVMWGYGMAKVLPIQFPAPGLARLASDWGDSPPMSVLWTFMGLSRPYCVFGGVLECAGAVLLLWRRTTTIGAIVLVGVLANVLMLNLCYDVPVKQWSAHLLLMAIALAAPDVRRLTRLLLARRAVRPAPLRLQMPGWYERTRPIFKAAFLLACVYAGLDGTGEQLAAIHEPTPGPLFGRWDVESFEPTSPDDVRWRRLLVEEHGVARVERVDPRAPRFWYRTEEDHGRGNIALSGFGAAPSCVLHYAQPDADHLTLEGDVASAHVTMRLRRVDQRFVLQTRGFHWVQETPFN